MNRYKKETASSASKQRLMQKTTRTLRSGLLNRECGLIRLFRGLFVDQRFHFIEFLLGFLQVLFCFGDVFLFSRQ